MVLTFQLLQSKSTTPHPRMLSGSVGPLMLPAIGRTVSEMSRRHQTEPLLLEGLGGKGEGAGAGQRGAKTIKTIQTPRRSGWGRAHGHGMIIVERFI